MLMDDGQPLTTIAYHEHFVLRWAKKMLSVRALYAHRLSCCKMHHVQRSKVTLHVYLETQLSAGSTYSLDLHLPGHLRTGPPPGRSQTPPPSSCPGAGPVPTITGIVWITVSLWTRCCLQWNVQHVQLQTLYNNLISLQHYTAKSFLTTW